MLKNIYLKNRMKYKAYLVEENEGKHSGQVKEIEMPSLDDGNVIIKVHYSSLNYKDALASSGVKGVVKSYPFVPGIDVAGEIIETSNSEFSVGDNVVATGYKIGMSVFGGFGELVQLPSKWVLKLPAELNSFDSMCYGTAGITAAACVKKIVDANVSNELPVLVSGATGGVGSISVGILSKLGYQVHAISGKQDKIETLKSMGASEIILRDEFTNEPVKALDKAIYGGAVDTVGGEILAKIISMVANQGVVSCCGNVAGAMFTSSVFPFILRGVQLSGIDSAESSLVLKKELWNLLSNEWSLNLTDHIKTIQIDGIGDEVKKILNGNQVGRVVIKHGD
jgi:putative YhdH/YhfP family quinone oxidoreductase|tara:strand:- start:1036 stop:2049 length:1014 start_codon:yes stop_codon:yes gene_type:complete